MATYNYTGAVQYVTVPQGIYTITAAGAEGGSADNGTYAGGLGAFVSGNFSFQANTSLFIIVGQAGGSTSIDRGGGGGGGSFVYVDVDNDGVLTNNDRLLLAAGGGGGANPYSGAAGAGGYGADQGSGSGLGGASGSTGHFDGGGGAGVNGGGGSTGDFDSGSGAANITSGGASPYEGFGGYGGGGGGGFDGGGGGGGYSGGAGGSGDIFPGGQADGGRSYIAPTATNGASTRATNPGDGQVSVTCYVTGTLISTSRGETAVEHLVVGDLVVTASGEHRPIKWIGTRSYIGRFANANPEVLPVCFKAGSVADGIPARDLRVSPKHAMFLDGALIPAEHLVNGVSIIKEQRVEELIYYHVELDSHDVLIAEGAGSESFVDDESRGIFHNAHTFFELYPQEQRKEAVYCAPRVESGFTLEAVRRRLNQRAGMPVPAARHFGALHGQVEGCDGAEVWGWAQDDAYPEAPVCLDVLVNGAVVGLVYADRPTAEYGDHGFVASLPRAPVSTQATVTVRRSADGTVLKLSMQDVPAVLAAA